MKTASLNDIMIKHIRNIGLMNAILNKNSEGSKYTYAQIIKSMDEFASQEREGIEQLIEKYQKESKALICLDNNYHKLLKNFISELEKLLKPEL